MLRRRALLALASTAWITPAQAADRAAEIDAALRAMLTPDTDAQLAGLKTLRDLNDRTAVPGLIGMLFWLDDDNHPAILETLQALTGAKPGDTWFAWMVWLQDHPEFPAHAGFDAYVGDLFAGLDPQFSRFVRIGIAHKIRLEEITWGGVKVDGIPALDDPAILSAADAGFLNPDDLVFGAVVGGAARAYPMRILAWHEMANDVLGGVPIVLAYCTLCGAAILFDGRVAGYAAPFRFGSSGLLYRSNKLMYDRGTDSLWNQFTGLPVMGALTSSGVALKPLPLVTTSWAAWRAAHPDTTVLSLATGFTRDYAPGVAYRSYFASPSLAFPAARNDATLAPKDKVFGLRLPGGVKGWKLALFAGGVVINDNVGLQNVVLIGDAAREEVRAYARDDQNFVSVDPTHLRAGTSLWTITETELRAPDGRTLPRLPGHIAYWFAWAGYFPGAY